MHTVLLSGKSPLEAGKEEEISRVVVCFQRMAERLRLPPHKEAKGNKSEGETLPGYP